MRYSKEKQNLHIETIKGVLVKEPDINGRALWRKLKAQNINLSRKYVTKLLWRTCDMLAADSKAKTERKAEFDDWYKRLIGILEDIETLKGKIKQLIQDYPEPIKLPPNFWI